MTRKDYEATARVIRRNLERAHNYGAQVREVLAVQDIAQEMADIFASDNPRFDRAKFLEACGLEATARLIRRN